MLVIILSVVLFLVICALVGVLLWHFLKKPKCHVCPTLQECPKPQECPRSMCLGLSNNAKTKEGQELVKAIAATIASFQQLGCSKFDVKKASEMLTTQIKMLGIDNIRCSSLKETITKAIDENKSTFQKARQEFDFVSNEDIDKIISILQTLIFTIIDLTCENDMVSIKRVNEMFTDIVTGFC